MSIMSSSRKGSAGLKHFASKHSCRETKGQLQYTCCCCFVTSSLKRNRILRVNYWARPIRRKFQLVGIFRGKKKSTQATAALVGQENKEHMHWTSEMVCCRGNGAAGAVTHLTQVCVNWGKLVCVHLHFFYCLFKDDDTSQRLQEEEQGKKNIEKVTNLQVKFRLKAEEKGTNALVGKWNKWNEENSKVLLTTVISNMMPMD